MSMTTSLSANDISPSPGTVHVPYQPPLDWHAVMAFYRLRAVAGIEQIDGDVYVRSVRCRDEPAVIEVRNDATKHALIVTIRGGSLIAADEIARNLRRVFDLDADIGAIASHLSRDPFLAPSVGLRPAMRVPSHWGPFETAMRAVLGQQVTLAAAARLNARLVERAGRAFAEPNDGRPHLLFPEPRDVLDADLSNTGMPGARTRTLKAVADAFLAAPDLFERGSSVEDTVERLLRIKGIGPWTAHYIALRACREPDAFPAGDAGLLRGTAGADGQRPSVEQLVQRAEAWRPWRAYAAHHIWALDQERIFGQRSVTERS
jgi:AraC family transcriptional regulator of adaptative response / DNA-3-methyladenine glycosylase II